MTERTYFFYLNRDTIGFKGLQSCHVATICIRFSRRTVGYSFGYSFCHPKDQFVKAVGREEAARKLDGAFTLKELLARIHDSLHEHGHRRKDYKTFRHRIGMLTDRINVVLKSTIR